VLRRPPHQVGLHLVSARMTRRIVTAADGSAGL
jgi:hypothetical protein